MVFRDRTRKIVTAVALGSLLTLGQAGVASAHGQRGDDDGYHRNGYIRTTTELTVYYRYACAEVSSHRGTPYGKVKFRLTGKEYDRETVYLRRGKACVGLSGLRPGWYRLTAWYEGNRRFRSSEDSETFKVRGRGYYKHKRYYDDHKRYDDDCKRYYDDHYSRYGDDYKRYGDDHYSRYGDDYKRYYDDCKRYYYYDHNRDYYYDHNRDYYDHNHDYYKKDDYKKDDWSKDYNKNDDWSKDNHTSNRDWENSRTEENKSWEGNGDSTRVEDNSSSGNVSTTDQPTTPAEVVDTTEQSTSQAGSPSTTTDQAGTSDGQRPCVVPDANSSDVAETSTNQNACPQ